MKSLAPARNRARIDRSQAGGYGILLLLLLFCARPLYAQVGNNNPSGPSGIFNGQAGGCGYDPYTANATRSITDIAVAGAVGEYPLTLVRTANSRAPSTTEVFGWAGGWNHNYNWILEDSPNSTNQNFQPSSYTVDFPDGRVETFQSVNWDPSCHRVRTINGGAGSSAGVRERFVPLNRNTMLASLLLPDGGKVEFQAWLHTTPGGRYYYKYSATAIIDPHGLRTTLQWEVVGPTHLRRLAWVIEPAGRSLHLEYVTAAGPRISQVTASDGRRVNYYYQYCNGCRLHQVLYYNNANWTAQYQYCNSNIGQGLPPLLWTADDPMYAGPMKRIAYDYKPATPANPDGTAPVYGQILRERYYDGTTVGAPVSTLTVGMPTNNPVYRTETRGDGATRVFIYNGAGAGYLAWASDFTGRYASQTYDSYKYINSVTDRNGNRTDYTLNSLTGNLMVVTYPLTQGDTPNQTQRPTVQYTYGWANCPDPNNRDANNPYYLYKITDEGNHATVFTRDANKRIYQTTYPDGGYERFPSYNSFNQVLTHLMLTGGTETFTYDARGLKKTYSDPYHADNNPPSFRYYYDTKDRFNGFYDALNHPTNWQYNDRGQVLVTTLATDPSDNQRHTITNAYNPDGTLQSKTDELGHMTRYEYDDYRRLRKVTPPVRGYGDNDEHPTTYTYHPSSWGDDYRHTSAQPTWVKLPSGKTINNIYDENFRKTDATVGWGTADVATTSYTYDAVGNVTWITNARDVNTAFFYDQRNRPSEVHDAYGNITYFQYDTAGRRKKVIRPNTQTITYDTFDNMNRVTQQTVTQAPNAAAVTKYTYYPSGLVNTMTDPRNSTDSYSYIYDLMGRKAWVTYPFDSSNPPANRVESFTYDDAGRLWKFRNRNGNYQEFHYDALNRMTYFTWDDNLTPRADFGYDAASRLTTINNGNASISRQYYNDGLMLKEIEQITGVVARQVAYTYDEDGNRATTGYPGYTFNYTYTGRNQLKTVAYYGDTYATYEYDANGNLTTRTLNNGTHTDYAYDALDRVTWATHSFGRWFNYDYDNVGNRKWAKRWNGQAAVGEVFRYDLADQAIAVQLNVPNPDQVQQPIPWTIAYDANGNRTNFHPYPGTTDVYTTNNLSEYTQRTRNGTSASAVYNFNGDVLTGVDGSVCTYDAQNRLLSTRKTNGPTMTFTYDGLNRQVSRTVNGDTTYNVWDGWNLIEEINAGGPIRQAYVYGPGGLIIDFIPGVRFNYYYQNGSGGTSHVTDENGNLKEWYRYDLQGTPIVNDDPNNHASVFGVRHLFTGQRWYNEIGLYDFRNRFYSPDVGRFLQPDPIGFRGDRTNLYRYCGNNAVTRSDRLGLESTVPTPAEKGVTVYAPPLPDPSSISRTGFLPGSFGGFFPSMGSDNPQGNRSFYNPLARLPEDDQPSVEHSPPSIVPPQNPPAPAPAPASPSSPSAPAAGVFSHWGAVTPIIVDANMRLDDDGSGPSHNDRYHSRFTSYRPSGVSLNADTVRYIVIPQYVLSQGVQLGDPAFVIGNGMWATAVVGDVGSSDRGWGEVSLATGWGLAVPTIDRPYPTGPVIPESFGPVPVTIIVIPSGY